MGSARTTDHSNRRSRDVPRIIDQFLQEFIVHGRSRASTLNDRLSGVNQASWVLPALIHKQTEWQEALSASFVHMPQILPMATDGRRCVPVNHDPIPVSF